MVEIRKLDSSGISWTTEDLLVERSWHSAGESDDGLQYGQAHPQKAGQMGNVGITRRAKLIAVCCIAIVAGFAVPTSAQEKQPLRLVRTIPLTGVTGRLDHMGVDLEKKRLFVAASANNTLEVVDLTGGKVINTLTGFKDPQDASMAM